MNVIQTATQNEQNNTREKSTAKTVISNELDKVDFTKDIYVNKECPTSNITSFINSKMEEITNPINFIFTEDCSFSGVVITRQDVKFTGNARITNDGAAATFTVQRPSTTSVSCTFDKNIITCTDTTGFKTGDYVYIYKKDTPISLTSMIVYMTDTTLTLTDNPLFTLTGHLLIGKVPRCNVVIDGLTFIGSSNSTQSAIIISSIGAVVQNCSFINGAANGIVVSSSGYNLIDNNHFENIGACVFIYNGCHIDIRHNTFNNIISGIRMQYVYSCIIDSNDMCGGKNSAYSTGIEINNQLYTYDMCCENVISNNKIVRMNLGRPGSAIGGIHLNYGAHHNTIINNVTSSNSIGIYLENGNCYNRIIGNICNNNIGWYGVGIELDWDNSYNVIDGNECSYNRADATSNSGESCGIELRSGITSGHIVHNNVVSNNICAYNDHCGIWASGQDTIVQGNTLISNGVNTKTYPDACDLYLPDFKNLHVIGNTIRTLVNAAYSVIICGATNSQSNELYFNDNAITCSNCSKDAVIRGTSVNDVYVTHNTITGSPKERVITFYGTNANGLKNVTVMDNMISAGSTGYNLIEVSYVTNHNLINNYFNGDKYAGVGVNSSMPNGSCIYSSIKSMGANIATTIDLSRVTTYKYVTFTLMYGKVAYDTITFPSVLLATIKTFKLSKNTKYNATIIYNAASSIATMSLMDCYLNIIATN